MNKDNTNNTVGVTHTIGSAKPETPSTAQANLDAAAAKRLRKNAKRLQEASKRVSVIDV